MKTVIIIILIGFILIGGILYLGYFSNNSNDSNLDVENTLNNGKLNQDTPEKTYNINIQNFAYSTIEIKIKKGDTIAWMNKDSVSHTITSDSGNELNSELLSEGKTYSHTFNVIGTYDYYCTPHPSMKGRVIVK